MNYEKEFEINSDSRKTYLTMPKIRRIAAQFCAILVPDLLSFALGLGNGFAVMLIPDVNKPDSEIKASLAELSWLGSMTFLTAPLSSLLSGWLTSRFGRRPILFLAAIVDATAWAVFRWLANDIHILILGFALLGLAAGVISTIVYTYAGEISEPKLRGALTSTIQISSMLGIFVPVLLHSYLHWRNMALIHMIFPVIAFFWCLVLPESPHWLIGKDRFEEAERSLRWLRGWTSSDNVKLEYNEMVTSISSNLKDISNAHRQKSTLQLYFRREVLLPFALVTFAFFASTFNGSVSMQNYSVLVFQKLGTTPIVDEYGATLIFFGLQFAGTLIFTMSVRKAGKRLLTFVSLIASSLMILATAVYVTLKNQNVIGQEKSHSWLPMTMLLMMNFAASLSIRSIPFYLSAEVFPLEVRGVAVAIMNSMGYLQAGAASKLFLYQLLWLTLPGTFLFFAIVNLIGFVVLYRVMPETEGVSLAEVQNNFTKNSKDDEIYSERKAPAFHNHDLNYPS